MDWIIVFLVFEGFVSVPPRLQKVKVGWMKIQRRSRSISVVFAVNSLYIYRRIYTGIKGKYALFCFIVAQFVWLFHDVTLVQSFKTIILTFLVLAARFWLSTLNTRQPDNSTCWQILLVAVDLVWPLSSSADTDDDFLRTLDNVNY